LFNERRGFTLMGLVPGFDRDTVTTGRIKRVSEALYGKVLTEFEWPDEEQLTAKTKQMLALVKNNMA
jgi:hypothetical protein